MKNTERFSNRVENYIRFRPHYPKEIIPFLKKEIGLTSQWTVADIGSGTGISTELFLQNGNSVFAVEPNKNMRQAAEALFHGDDTFISVDATAEATSLPNHSIDLIVAGQAFHWFDPIKAKNEFQRIAHGRSYLLLLWNERKLESSFQQAYEQMLLDLAPAYEQVCQFQVDDALISEFFSPHPYKIKSLSNFQYFDFEGLKGRLLSCSYAPLQDHPNYHPIMQRLEQLFDQFNVDDKVMFEYDCKLYYGQFY